MYDKMCANCKTMLSEFYDTGMLGCPECYTAFWGELLSAIKKVQGSTVHKGKKPTVDGLNKELLVEYASLLSQKEKAIIDGNFKDANEISKMLVDLTDELKKRGLL